MSGILEHEICTIPFINSRRSCTISCNVIFDASTDRGRSWSYKSFKICASL